MIPVNQTLTVVVGASYASTLTVSSASGAQLGLLGATAELKVFVTPEDPAPRVDVTTTPGVQGGLVLGVTFPSPGGLACSNASGLEQLGLASSTQALPDVSLYVADITALETATTAGYILGSLACVEASAGAFYAWSPLDPSTPNGTTVVAGDASTGNWLWAGTVSIAFTPAATAALAGYDTATCELLVTFADGEVACVLSGRIVALPTAPTG